MTQTISQSRIASVRDRLRAISDIRSENFEMTLVRYALERFLVRLSQTDYRSKFILKGAMLFEIWSGDTLRATRDLDFSARGQLTVPVIFKRVKEICKVESDDGLFFDLSELAVEEIRRNDDYGGFRAELVAYLGNTRMPMQIDFGIGDAISPGPVEVAFPVLLGKDEPLILSYPPETVIAEKLETIVNLGLLNTRLKDYFDLWFFATSYPLSTEKVADAIRQTFGRRGRAIPKEVPDGLTPEFSTDPLKLKLWETFLAKHTNVAFALDEAVDAIRTFALPIFEVALKPNAPGS